MGYRTVVRRGLCLDGIMQNWNLVKLCNIYTLQRQMVLLEIEMGGGFEVDNFSFYIDPVSGMLSTALGRCRV